MVNGREEMMNSVKSELTFLDSMRKTGIENIEYAKTECDAAQAILTKAHELQARFEHRTEMCWKLQEALESYGSAMEALEAL